MKELGRHWNFHTQIIELASLNLTKIIFIGDEFYKFKKISINLYFIKTYPCYQIFV